MMPFVSPLSMLLYAPEYVSSIRGVLLKGLLGESGGPHGAADVASVLSWSTLNVAREKVEEWDACDR
jgi:hypothetical protein